MTGEFGLVRPSPGLVRRASMRPRSNDRGIETAANVAAIYAEASMRPRSNDRGIVQLQRRPVLSREASMRPRSNDRGILNEVARAVRVGLGLQ